LPNLDFQHFQSVTVFFISNYQDIAEFSNNFAFILYNRIFGKNDYLSENLPQL